MDSFPSAVEIGTGEDLTTAVITSFKGRTLRLREGVEEPPPAGLEKSLEFACGQESSSFNRLFYAHPNTFCYAT